MANQLVQPMAKGIIRRRAKVSAILERLLTIKVSLNLVITEFRLFLAALRLAVQYQRSV